MNCGSQKYGKHSPSSYSLLSLVNYQRKWMFFKKIKPTNWLIILKKKCVVGSNLTTASSVGDNVQKVKFKLFGFIFKNSFLRSRGLWFQVVHLKCSTFVCKIADKWMGLGVLKTLKKETSFMSFSIKSVISVYYPRQKVLALLSMKTIIEQSFQRKLL